MKQPIIYFFLLISSQSFCQVNDNQINHNIQEGEVYYFDMRKHACGQMYSIKLYNDTIFTRNLLNLDFNHNELPIKVYLSIAKIDEVTNRRCGFNGKSMILGSIKRR
jgi:hypothetical protein